MNTLRVTLSMFVMSIVLLAATFAGAADFDWTKNLRIRAEADPSGFRAQLSTRFGIGDAQVRVVLGKVDDPADAYVVLRLGEMSSKSTDYVLDKYRSDKNQGWGSLAKSLGIKQGSKEFHALKQGSDLEDSKNKNGKKNKNNGKGKNK